MLVNQPRSYQINDMIKLFQIKKNTLKMLHCPSLKILIIKLYDCNNISLFLDFIKYWINLSTNKDYKFLKVKGINKSNKDNCVSLIYKYCEYGSLSDLLDNIEFINEHGILFLFKEIALRLKLFKKKFKREFGDIRCSQILFNNKYELILNFSSSNILNYEMCEVKTFITDIFRLGIICLRSSLGFLINTILEILIGIFSNDIFFIKTNENYFNMLNLDYYFDIKTEYIMFDINNKFNSEYCCFIHFILGINRKLIRNSFYENKIKMFKKINKDLKFYRKALNNFIYKNFDSEFVKFFCFITRFDKDERLTIDQSLNHNYFNCLENKYSDNSKGFIKISDIILSSFNINNINNNANDIDYFSQNILNVIKKYFKNGEKWFKINNSLYLTNTNLVKKDDLYNSLKLITIDSKEIINLSNELGVNRKYFWEKIINIFN